MINVQPYYNDDNLMPRKDAHDDAQRDKNNADRIQERVDQCMAGTVTLIMEGELANKCFELDTPLDAGVRYKIGGVECRMCNAQMIHAWPIDGDDDASMHEDSQECDECEHMTCEAVAEDEVEIQVT